jgi:hypothetical protein
MRDYTIRLADRLAPLFINGQFSLLVGRERLQEPERYDRLLAQFCQTVAQAPRFVIDHVTQHWLEAEGQYTSSDHFPYARPPYDTSWFETTRPILPPGTVLPEVAPRMWGALVHVTTPAADAPPQTHWSVINVPAFLVDVHGEERIVLVGTLIHHLDEHGSILKGAFGREWTGAPFVQPRHLKLELPDDADRDKRWLTFASAFMDPLLLACSLLHCVNVDVEEVAPPPKLAKAYARRHQTALTTHRVVHVAPRMARRAAAREGPRQRSTPRRHMVRGHFCHRRKPGTQLKQLWWRGSYLKGDGARGAVAHDHYTIDPE